MYSLQSLWDIFHMEFFLFGGVPETALQMYERESHGHEEVRLTREALGNHLASTNVENEDIFCHMRFDKATGDFCQIEVSSP
jgi:hypothetical protein